MIKAFSKLKNSVSKYFSGSGRHKDMTDQADVSSSSSSQSTNSVIPDPKTGFPNEVWAVKYNKHQKFETPSCWESWHVSAELAPPKNENSLR